MDRQIVKSGQIPLETDLLNSERSTMIALAALAQGVLGTATLVDGLACTPTSPASMVINVAPGQIYEIANIDASSYSTLAADTVHNILKQGLMLDAASFTLTAPPTSGQAQNYLVQVTYVDVDDTPVVRPYYNSASPSIGLSGPGGSGTPDNTFRRGKCLVSVKAGVAAASPSQVTPAPDPGYVGLFSVTVPNGATTITSGNITQLASAPFISPKLPAVPANVQNGAWTYAPDTGTANNLVVALSPAPAAYATGLQFSTKLANTITAAAVINLNGLGNKSLVYGNGASPPPHELVAGTMLGLEYDGTNVQIVWSSSPPARWRKFFDYTVPAGGLANIDINPLPSWATLYRITTVIPGSNTTGQSIALRVSFDGSTFLSGSTSYLYFDWTSSTQGFGSTANAMQIATTVDNTVAAVGINEAVFYPGSPSTAPRSIADLAGLNANYTSFIDIGRGHANCQTAGTAVAIRFVGGSYFGAGSGGNIPAGTRVIIEGMP